jgi:hypothetical protein
MFVNSVLHPSFFFMISVSELHSKNGTAGILLHSNCFCSHQKCLRSWFHSYTVGFYKPEIEYGYLDFPHTHHTWLLLSVRKVSYFRSLQTKLEIDLPVSKVIEVYWIVLGVKPVDRHA